MDFSTVSDEALIAKIDCLARTERFALADFLIHLNELDKRDACERRGYPSVFAYLTRHLGYSESDAIRRVRAARAIRRFPSALRMVAKGELHLVGLSMLQPYLTATNHRAVLRQACGKSQREIEKLAAQLAPEALEPRDTIRALPPPKTVTPNPAPDQETALPLESDDATIAPQAPLGHAPETRHLFSFAAGDSVQQLFLQARDLLRHKFPEGKMEDIIGEALRRLIDDELPSISSRKMPAASLRGTRHIPERVKKQVWDRDEGRCAYIGDSGIRCAETGWLEFDHKIPWAMGGRSDDPANIRLLCRAHNQSEARRAFPHLDKFS